MIKKILYHTLSINIIKTLYFNFRCLPFYQALKLPILIYRQTKLRNVGGCVKVESDIVCTGMIKIGPYGVGIKDGENDRTIWDVNGTVIFKGRCLIGRGSKICVGMKGVLLLGDKFSITGNSSIICYKNISIGNDCLFSWDILLMDTDFHEIYDKYGNRINEDKSIFIGDKVWIGCRSLILKGVTIESNNIIAANSTITSDILVSGNIIVTNGRVVKSEVSWHL